MGSCPSRQSSALAQPLVVPQRADNTKLYAALGITTASERGRFWFRTAVRRIIGLLKARKIWAKYGHHQNNNVQRKRLWEGLVRRGGTPEISGFLVRTKGYSSESPEHRGTERKLDKEGPGRTAPYNVVMAEGFFVIGSSKSANDANPKPKPKSKRKPTQPSR